MSAPEILCGNVNPDSFTCNANVVFDEQGGVVSPSLGKWRKVANGELAGPDCGAFSRRGRPPIDPKARNAALQRGCTGFISLESLNGHQPKKVTDPVIKTILQGGGRLATLSDQGQLFKCGGCDQSLQVEPGIAASSDSIGFNRALYRESQRCAQKQTNHRPFETIML